MSELLKTMFGEYTSIQLLGYLWFFLIGYIIYFLTETTGRNVQNPHTPTDGIHPGGAVATVPMRQQTLRP